MSKINRRIDDVLEDLCEFAGATAEVDKGIKLLSYTSWFLSRFLPSVIRTSDKTKRERIHKICVGLRKVYTELFMARYAPRLFGIPLCIEGIRNGSWASPEYKDKRIHQLGNFMAWSMLFYYPLEHVAYARWVAPELIDADAEKFSAYSCRAWALYVVADIVSSFLKIRELCKRDEDIRKQLASLKISEEYSKSDGKVQMKEWENELEQLERKKYLQRLQLWRNAFYFLPLVNWSLPNWETDPWLPENLRNGLMLAESIICIWQSIYSYWY
mmetsp:Transcript_16805/g.26218  ORF Transcript_16805/g.26218 Transcript_16805/m.26218 type:complete len:271 (+) Transcript_16805:262-1074(+)